VSAAQGERSSRRRRRLARLSAVAICLALSSPVVPLGPVAAAGGDHPSSGHVRIMRDVPFMTRMPCADRPTTGCVNDADIYVPSASGTPGPTIVLIHGRPRWPSDMAKLALALARKGALVFNLDYRGVRPAVTRGFPRTMSDVACGVRFARSRAAQLGGRPDHLVLVGHSMGGYVGMLVALDGDRYPSQRGTCLADRGDDPPAPGASLPQGYVTVAGVSHMHPDYEIDQVYFGGTIYQVPQRWSKGSVFTQAWRRPRMPVGIIFETHDPFMTTAHATDLAAALRHGGHRVELVLETTGSTHFDILDPASTPGAAALALIERLVKRSTPRSYREKPVRPADGQGIAAPSATLGPVVEVAASRSEEGVITDTLSPTRTIGPGSMVLSMAPTGRAVAA
jgi:pimeloyl-ACP methyl ester carboxylesterase